MKWCLNGFKDIGDIAGLQNELPDKSKIILNKHNTEDSFTASSKQSEKKLVFKKNEISTKRR